MVSGMKNLLPFNPEWHHPYARVALIPARITRDTSLVDFHRRTFVGVGAGDRVYIIKDTIAKDDWLYCWCVQPGANTAFRIFRTDFEIAP